MSDAVYRKSGPEDALAFEAAGLRWLAEAEREGGAPVVEVVEAGPGVLHTRMLAAGSPSPAAAEAFGRALARTHAAGAPHHGCPPPGFAGEGAMGHAPLPLRSAAPASWGAFYAEDRILPYLPAARRALGADGAAVVERCASRVADGEFDASQPALVRAGAARLHGDLWSGNVLWAGSDGGAVTGTLIDPAAQGGHAESDLAQLGVFGAPHRERILAAYDEASPLAEGWQERIALHQLHILIVHAALFGGPYGPQTAHAASAYA